MPSIIPPLQPSNLLALMHAPGPCRKCGVMVPDDAFCWVSMPFSTWRKTHLYHYCVGCHSRVGYALPVDHFTGTQAEADALPLIIVERKVKPPILISDESVRLWEKQQKKAKEQTGPESFGRRVSELRAMRYSDYLQTDHWKGVRQRALDAAAFRCQICNATDQLQVHHRTYVNKGCERPEDVTVLCDRCHSMFHGKLPKVPF